MATQRQFRCDCGFRVEEAWNLYDALDQVASGAISTCADCTTRLKLHLSFSFALDADGKDFIVAACYRPRHKTKAVWQTSEGKAVEFVPFLVVAEKGSERAIWLPYWHVVQETSGPKYRYGQFAPFMDAELFIDLVEQASADGWLAGATVQIGPAEADPRASTR